MAKPLHFLFAPSRFMALLLLWPIAGVLNGQADIEIQCEDTTLFRKVDIVNKTIAENLEITEEKIFYFKEASNWDCYIQSLNDKSYLFYFKGDYHAFIAHSKMVMELAIEKLTEDAEAMINVMLTQAIAVELAGDYSTAIALQSKAARTTNNHELKFYAYENNGVSYEYLGDYDEAIRNYGYILQILKGLEKVDPHNNGRVLRQMAFCYMEKGDLNKSLNLYQQSLDILHRLPSKTFYNQTLWYAYQDLSGLYLKRGQPDSAMHYSDKAISILRKTSNLMKSYLTYIGHGDIWLAKGNYKKAIASFDKALALAGEEYKDFEKHLSFASCLHKKAEAYLKMNEYQTALALCQKALQKAAVNFESGNQLDNPSPDQLLGKLSGLDILATKAEILLHLFEMEAEQGHLQAAYQTYAAACGLIQSIRQDYMAEGSKHALAQKALPIYEMAIETALMLYEAQHDKQYLESAYSIAEGNKATLLYESIKNNMAKGIAGIPDTLLNQEAELIGKRNFNQKLIREELQKKGAADAENIKLYEKMVFELNAELEKLTGEMEAKYPAYLEQKNQTAPATYQSTRLALPNDHTALVEYMVGEKNGYVFTLSKNGLQVSRIKNIQDVGLQISRLRELLLAPPNARDFNDEYLELVGLTHALYDQLLKDAIRNLPHGTDQLVIVPDDVLCYLPFELLLREKANPGNISYSPASLSYLMEDFNISYQYSVSLMAASKKNARSYNGLKSFAGFAPAFEGGHATARTCNADQLYSLICNEEEVGGIQKLLGGESFMAERANLGNFMLSSPNHRILHLATHACVDDSDAGLNKIYLADGDLSQFELNNLRLQAELTVLSACNTGMGQLLKGEGIMSLTRSFMTAGSQSVLTSLWSVDDCATSNIMVEYYKCLKKGMPKDKAIARAKLEYLKTADRNNSHPYYWAAFVQFGDVEAMDLGSNFHWFSLVGAVGLVMLFVFWKSKNK